MPAAKLMQWTLRSPEHLLLQVPRALVASGLSASLDFGILVALVQYAGWNPMLAATASYLLAGLLQYVLCSVWVFPAAPGSAVGGFVVFTILNLGGLGITWAAMGLFFHLARLNYALAKIVALGLAFSWNFVSRKYWIFSPIPLTVQPPSEDRYPSRSEPALVDGPGIVVLEIR